MTQDKPPLTEAGLTELVDAVYGELFAEAKATTLAAGAVVTLTDLQAFAPWLTSRLNRRE